MATTRRSSQALGKEASLLPFTEYHAKAVRELFAIILRPGTSLRQVPPEKYPPHVDECVQLNAPNLAQLNAFLGQLEPCQSRAIVALLGLDDGKRKSMEATADRFGISKPAINTPAARAIVRLRHGPKTKLPAT